MSVMVAWVPFHTECLNEIKLVSPLKTFCVLFLWADTSTVCFLFFGIRKVLFVDLL
jgi:hypothetical protein